MECTVSSSAVSSSAVSSSAVSSSAVSSSAVSSSVVLLIVVLWQLYTAAMNILIFLLCMTDKFAIMMYGQGESCICTELSVCLDY